MNDGVSEVLSEFSKVSTSLKSVGKIEKNFKYSWDPEKEVCYRDLDFVAYLTGNGWLSSWSQAFARTAKNSFTSDDSHQTLADNLGRLKLRTHLLSSNIASLVVFDRYLNIKVKRDLQNRLEDLQRYVNKACDGIDRLKCVYLNEQDKHSKITLVHDQFKELKQSIESQVDKVGSKIIQEEGNRMMQAAVEGRRLSTNELRRRTASDGTMLRQSPRRKSFEPYRSSLPDGLTDADMVDTYEYLQGNEEIFDSIIERQVEKNPNCDSFFLRKNETPLPRSAHFFSIDEFYLKLKNSTEKGNPPSVKHVMRFSDRKVLLSFNKVLNSEEQIQRASNQIKYLDLFHQAGEIASLLHVCRYLSKENVPKMSLIMDDYNEGTLNRAVAEGSLTSFQKYQIALDIMHAVKYLHDIDIVHLNLKPQFVLLKREIRESSPGDKVAAAITGLEFARPYEDDKHYNKSLDVWMLGHVLYFLFFGEVLPTFEFLIEGNVFDAIFPALYGEEPLFTKPGTMSIEHLLWLMLHPSPEQRPDIDDAIAEFEKLFSGIVKLNELKKNRRKNRR